MTRARSALFIALVVVGAAAGIGLVLHARSGRPEQLAGIMGEPHVVFRNTELGPDYARVAVVPLSDPSGPRVVTPLTCDRVAMAGGIGVCGATTTVATYASYAAKIFDSQFEVRGSVPLLGAPDRVRVSPDGRWASVTMTVPGDADSDGDNAPTRATIIATARARDLGDVGRRDRDSRCVTFAADSDRFYATQAEGFDVRLIEGRRSSGEAHTLARHVDCPALSPDQTRVAYEVVSGPSLEAARRHLHVLDLRTGKDRALAERRSVDDQVEWLDDDTVLYTIPRPDSGAVTDVWSVPADGSGTPQVFISGASSPSVDRGK